jgi:hypothetical protein
MKRFQQYSRRQTWFTVLLMGAFATGCGGGGGRDPILGSGDAVLIVTPPPGAIAPGAVCSAATSAAAPTVTMSDPTNGNQSVTTSTNGVAGGGKLIAASFSSAMNPATVNASTFVLAPAGGAALVPASVNYNASSRVATLTTTSPLLPGTSYNVVIQGAANSAGTVMGCSHAWSFKTAAVAASGSPPVAVTAPGLPPVDLGSATTYAIASAAGVTNNLLTTINGNAVLNPTATCNGDPVPGGTFGSCLGAPPTIVGTVVTSTFPNTTTANAVTLDLRKAYDSITPANLPGATVLGCGIIGSSGGAGALPGCAGNSTLAPGVYISATASTIGVTGVLTLDGQGDANARFIFQAPSALTAAAGAPGLAGSEIRLINGARASNVFWQVGSSATIGTYALFQGNVLADTSITMGNGSTSCGRLLAGAVTTSGAFVFDRNSVSVPGHASAPAGCQ